MTGQGISLASGLAADIASLLEVKHAIGWPYAASERHLRTFDALCAREFPGQTTLTRQMAMRWAGSRPGEHVNGQMRRITPVRQLAKHILGRGAHAYVIPTGIPGRQVRYRPHLFTHTQLRAIFDAADQIAATPYGGQRHVIFRMIYCLGLRPGEARRLHRTDVDLTRGALYVRESKGHKDRRVFMSGDLHEYCRRYDAVIGAYQPERVAFFPNHAGGTFHASTIDCWFHELLTAAGTTAVAVPGSPPRVYDLRHAHVIETVNRCTRTGGNPEALVTYLSTHLSTHLGRTNAEDTWYYFHLAAEFHPDLRALANTGIEPVLPEACHGIG